MRKILILFLVALLGLSISLNLFQFSTQETRNSQSNSLQTQYLISQLRPYPTPSYTVSSPYESITPAAGA